MTPAEFNRAMAAIVKERDVEIVKRQGLRLIIRALGENAPAYLDGLFALHQRLEPSPEPRQTVEPIT